LSNSNIIVVEPEPFHFVAGGEAASNDINFFLIVRDKLNDGIQSGNKIIFSFLKPERSSIKMMQLRNIGLNKLSCNNSSIAGRSRTICVAGTAATVLNFAK
jgi:hypothetical protein